MELPPILPPVSAPAQCKGQVSPTIFLPAQIPNVGTLLPALSSFLPLTYIVPSFANVTETHLTCGSLCELRVLILWLPGQLGLGCHVTEERVPALHCYQHTCQFGAPYSKWTSTKWHTSHSQPGSKAHAPKDWSTCPSMARLIKFTERNWQG